MIVDVTVPKWGLTMKEAEIVKWLKKEGDSARNSKYKIILPQEEAYKLEVSEKQDNVI